MEVRVDFCDDSGKREIELYVPFWIVTYSAHNLYFQHDVTYVNEDSALKSRLNPILNGKDDLSADQTLVNLSQLPVEASDPSESFGLASRWNENEKVASFGGEKLTKRLEESVRKYVSTENSEYSFQHPYRLMMCGFTRENPEESENYTHLRFRIDEYPWSNTMKLAVCDFSQQSVAVESMAAKSSSKNTSRSSTSKLFGASNPFGAPLIHDQVSEFAIKSMPMNFPFTKTKLVIFMDKYILINLIGQGIRVRQYGCNNIYDMDDKDEITMSWRAEKPKVIQIRLSAHGWLYSGRISCATSGTTTILLRNGQDQQTIFLVECSIINSGGCIYTIFKTANFISPFRVENRTKTAIRFYQIDHP